MTVSYNPDLASPMRRASLTVCEAGAMSFKVPSKRSRESSVSSARTNSKRHSSISRSSPIVSPHPFSSPQRRVSLRPPPSSAQSVTSARGSSIAGINRGDEPEDDAAINEREESDALNEVVMAVDVKGRGNVGCSYYVAREEKLYFMEDVKLGGVEVVDMCWYSRSLFVAVVRVDRWQ